MDEMLESEDIPQELQDIIDQHMLDSKAREESKRNKLELLSKVIAGKRDEAVRARKASGIETIWEEDQNHYEGIDEYNRGALKPQYTKSRSVDGGLMSNTANKNSNQCTAAFNITRQFVDSASARMGDILLPAGDWNWGIKRTPLPEYVSQLEQGNTYDQSGAPVAGPVPPECTEDKAEQCIKDYLVETRYHAENRKCIESAAQIGCGVLKGPFPEARKAKVFYNGTLVIQEEIKPATKFVSPWDFFPDYPNCGDDIQSGEFVIERDYITAKELIDLAENEGLGYFADAIQKVIEEGPGKKYATESRPANTNKDLYEIWYFTGALDAEDAGLFDEEDSECLADYRNFVIVMVNDTVIKGHEDPLSTGEFPYDVMRWQKMAGHWAGIGVARQGREAQQFMTASARNLVDNMGLSAIPMVAMRREGIEPEDKVWEIRKGKVWWLTDEMVKAIAESIQFLQVPNMQKELIANMQLATKMFEDATGINFLLQGQQGSAPDTVGGMELLHRNASALLRRIARIYDEDVTERHIKRYHDWVLLYGEDDEKCDLQIEAIGSSALVEREIQAQQTMQLLQASMNPAFGLSPAKTMAEMLRGMRFEPSKFLLDDAEKEELSKRQPPPAPAVQAAQIRSQADLQKAQMQSQAEMQRIKADTDRDTLFQQSVADRNQMQFQHQQQLMQLEIQKLQLEERLAMIKYSTEQNISLEQLKTKLASDTMKLQVQKELAALDSNTVSQTITPPTEPAGRAQPGHAYQQ